VSGNSLNIRQKVIGGLMLVFAVAVVARAAYELLAPLVPWLIALVTLVVIYAVIVGKFRR
jgi:hypothetical protein